VDIYYLRGIATYEKGAGKIPRYFDNGYNGCLQSHLKQP
jgi:hypothetical protein